MKLKSIASTIIATLVLAGCNSTPLTQNELMERELLNKVTPVESIIQTPEGLERINKTRYLARNLMGSEDRKNLTTTLQSEAVRWDPTAPAIGFLGSAVLTGNPFSLEGSSKAIRIGTIVKVADMFFDGSIDVIGQSWLPDTYNNTPIETAEEANQIAIKTSIEAVLNTLQKEGYTANHLGTFDTDGLVQLVTATLNEQQELSTPAKPENIVVLVTIVGYKAIEAEDYLETLSLGFRPAFTSHQAGHQIHILGGSRFDENNNVVMETTPSGFSIVEAQSNINNTALGRTFLRDISNQIPWVQGSNTVKGRYVVHNGKYYSVLSTTYSRFLKNQIDG